MAIIIPFRHRENHLKYWLHYVHPILRRQRIDYGIYIINQVQQPTFVGYGLICGCMVSADDC